jgi:dihydroxy-acid dehydratase
VLFRSGGPLALVADGDQIVMDIPARRLDVLVEPAEMARRAATWQPPAPRFSRGALARYAALVGSAARDAVLETGTRARADKD